MQLGVIGCSTEHLPHLAAQVARNTLQNVRRIKQLFSVVTATGRGTEFNDSCYRDT